MLELVKSALQKTSLYPAAKEFYRVAWKRSFISNRKRLIDFYRPLLPRGGIVFDVGANRGEFTDAFLRLGATVHAIEPHPTCTKELKALYGHDRKFNLVDCALGSAPGEARGPSTRARRRSYRCRCQQVRSVWSGGNCRPSRGG